MKKYFFILIFLGLTVTSRAFAYTDWNDGKYFTIPNRNVGSAQTGPTFGSSATLSGRQGIYAYDTPVPGPGGSDWNGSGCVSNGGNFQNDAQWNRTMASCLGTSGSYNVDGTYMTVFVEGGTSANPCQSLDFTACYSTWNGNASSEILFWGVPTYSNPPPPPGISFKYPLNGSNVPLFSPWLLTAINTKQSDFYQVRLQWYATEHNNSSTVLSRRFNNIAYGTGLSLETNGIKIPRLDFGVDFASTTDVYAFAQLYDTQNPDNPTQSLAFPIMVASTTEVFSLLTVPQSNGDFVVPSFGTSTDNVTTSTRPVGALENPTIGLPGDCSATSTFDFWSPGDWKCIVSNQLNDWIANTSAYGNGTITTAMDKIQQVFPLNIFSMLNKDIDLASASSTTMNDPITLVGHGTIFPGRTFTFFNSSTTSWISEIVGFDYRGFISKIIYLFTAGVMVGTAFMIIRSMKENTA